MNHASPSAQDPLDRLLASSPIHPSPDFTARVMEALHRPEAITEETIDRLLSIHPCQPSEEFTEKVLQQAHRQRSAQPSTVEYLPGSLQQTLAWAAVAVFSLLSWYQVVQSPNRRQLSPEPAASVPLGIASNQTLVHPAEDGALRADVSPQIEEILLLAEGLRDAGTLLDADTLEVLAVMLR